MGTVPRVSNGQEIDTGDWDWDEKRDMEAILEKLGWRGVADAHAWYEGKGGLPARKDAYKLPHHRLVGGKLVLSRRGVQRAMAALNGARGGTDLPASDRRRVYNHLKAHYEELGEDVPDLKE